MIEEQAKVIIDAGRRVLEAVNAEAAAFETPVSCCARHDKANILLAALQDHYGPEGRIELISLLSGVVQALLVEAAREALGKGAASPVHSIN